MRVEEILEKGHHGLSEADVKLLRRTAKNCKNFLEIGSRCGCSSMLFGEIAKRNGGHLYCVEMTPQPEWYQNIIDCDLTEVVTLIKGISPWVNLSEIPTLIDYLFIDGDHRTRWAVMDYHFWAPFVKPGGYIAFHDYTYSVDNCGKMVQAAIKFILKDSKNIKQVAAEMSEPGTIVFRKKEDYKC